MSGSHTPEVNIKLTSTSATVSYLQELTQLEEELLDKPISFAGCQIDPSPFQLVERTSLYKVYGQGWLAA